MSGGDLFGFVQQERVNGPFGCGATGSRFRCVSAIGDSMNKKDSGLSVSAEIVTTTEQMIDYAPKEYTWSQSLVIGLKFFLVAGVVTGLLWGIEKLLYK